MLLSVSFTIIYLSFVTSKELIAKVSRPYAIFPIPFELPNRNDRSDQCWLRIEDIELVETVTVYCYIAQAFLRSYINDYNYRKMDEDKVDLGVWSDALRYPEASELKISLNNSKIKDWKVTTVLDPTVNKRIYVSKNADCKLIMYSREGMTNYRVDCEKILYFVNSRSSDSTNLGCAKIGILLMVVICLLCVT